MTDTAASYLPDVRNWKWSQLGKAAAVVAFGWVMFVAYKATDEVAGMARQGATLALEVSKIKAEMQKLASKEAVAVLSARFDAIEKPAQPQVTTGSIKKPSK